MAVQMNRNRLTNKYILHFVAPFLLKNEIVTIRLTRPMSICYRHICSFQISWTLVYFPITYSFSISIFIYKQMNLIAVVYCWTFSCLRLWIYRSQIHSIGILAFSFYLFIFYFHFSWTFILYAFSHSTLMLCSISSIWTRFSIFIASHKNRLPLWIAAKLQCWKSKWLENVF